MANERLLTKKEVCEACGWPLDGWTEAQIKRTIVGKLNQAQDAKTAQIMQAEIDTKALDAAYETGFAMGKAEIERAKRETASELFERIEKQVFEYLDIEAYNEWLSIKKAYLQPEPEKKEEA